MSSVNWGRVVLGGLVAGLIINVSEFVLNAVVLEKDWAAVLQLVGKPSHPDPTQIAVFNVLGFLTGGFAIWLYAAIRPRYGAGPKTALCSGIAVWFIGYLLALIAPANLGMFPMRVFNITVLWSFPELLLATLAGAWLYREAEAPMQHSKAAAAH